MGDGGRGFGALPAEGGVLGILGLSPQRAMHLQPCLKFFHLVVGPHLGLSGVTPGGDCGAGGETRVSRMQGQCLTPAWFSSK